MPRYEWEDREDMRRGDPRRADPRRDRDDFGQADYSTDYGYDPRHRTGYRVADDGAPRDDYGQADYSEDFVYDEREHRAHRRFAEDDRDYARRMDEGEYRAERERHHGPRSWMDRAGGFFSGRREDEHQRRRRRGPSDRVLWAVIVERLEDERRLDLSDVEVIVEDCEVTLNGTVRRKEDKRRVEDIADIDGVRHVQNNLRVRDRGHWAFI